MKKNIILIILIKISIIYSQQNDWENQKVFGINKEYYHVNVVPYPNLADALEGDFSNSSFFRSLNGTWKLNYCNKPSDAPIDFFQPEYSVSDWSNVKVPYSLENAGFGEFIFRNIVHPFKYDNPPYVGNDFNPVASYRTNFSVPADWKDRQILINFDGVESAFYLWINGHKVGYSENSYCPAEFDITPYLNSGNNIIAVQVYRFSDGSYLEDQDFWRLSGIFRDVYIYSVPQAAVFDYSCITDLDENYKNAQLDIALKLKNYSIVNNSEEYSVEMNLFDSSGKIVLNEKSAAVKFTNSDEQIVKISKYVPNPLKWTAETPNLYTLCITLMDEKGNNVEYISTQIGFREVEWKDGILKVNGQRILIRGVNRHEHDPESGRYISRESMIEDIELMKQFNINAVRTSHYTNSPLWYKLCDQYGIYICAEANLESHHYWDRFAKDSTWLESFLDRNSGNYEPNKNHPSIIYWSLGNESGFGPNHVKMSEWLHKNDPTRPVHYNPANEDPSIDIIGPMYPTVEAFAKYANKNDRPVIMCEYAHAMGNSCGNLKEYWEPSYSHPSAQGGFIWDWVDQGFYKKDNNGKTYIANARELNDTLSEHFNAFDGLVLADRTPQPELYEYKYIIQPVKISASNLSKGIIKILNRYEFTNLNTLDGYWDIIDNGKIIQSGQLDRIDIEPGMEKEITIPFAGIKYMVGKEYFLNINFKLSSDTKWANKGHLVAWEQLKLNDEDRFPDYMFTPDDNLLQKKETDELIRFSGNNFSIELNKKSGLLSSLKNHGQEILKQGPAAILFRAPTDNDEMTWDPTSPAANWKKAGLDFLKSEVTKIEAKKNESGFYEVAVRLKISSDSTNHIMNNNIKYNIFSNGDIFIQCGFEFIISPAELSKRGLARIGMQMILPEDFENYKYYGSGPWENYSDRNNASKIGEYTSTVKDQYFPYSRPQQTGNKTNIRWASLTNNEGTGIALFGYPFLEATALHYSEKDLDKKSISEIKPRPEIYFTIDHQQSGLGGASCGPGVRPEYFIPVENKYYTFRISLVNKETDIPSLVSESPFLSPPVINPSSRVLFNNQFIEMSSSFEDAEIRYTLNSSEPDLNSFLYKEAIKINKDCEVRAKAFKKRMMPSESSSHMYEVQELLLEKPVMKYGDPAEYFEIPLEGIRSLGIIITDPDHANDWDHADILEPELVKKDGSVIKLTSLKPEKTFQGWGALSYNKTVDGNLLKVRGVSYKFGLGTHAEGEIWYKLNDQYSMLKLALGVDDDTNGNGSSILGFQIVGIKD